MSREKEESQRDKSEHPCIGRGCDQVFCWQCSQDICEKYGSQCMTESTMQGKMPYSKLKICGLYWGEGCKAGQTSDQSLPANVKTV